MSGQELVPDVESLAAMSPGQEFEIVRVLVSENATGDTYHHLRAGRHWSCRYSGSATLLLINRTGQTISVRRDLARFVQVTRTTTGRNAVRRGTPANQS